MGKVIGLLLIIFSTVDLSAYGNDKSVLIAILARNKSHVLPTYLTALENLDYDKKAITIYINTNNNEDNTAEILKKWTSQHREHYAEIIYDEHYLIGLKSSRPHEWNAQRFKALAEIRNKSLSQARDLGCEYYFVIDCDNFIKPHTLRELVNKDKPIIAPMLRSIPEKDDAYSNFFCAIDPRGYYRSSPFYFKILHRQNQGTFEVPVVHCTYLIKSEWLDKLSYIDGSDDYEFVIFSRLARENGVKQYICNESDFGVLLHFNRDLTLAEEAAEMEKITILQ